jgi:nitrogen fixation NifU-like protein
MSRFSETLMDHFASPRNVGTMDNPECIGQAGTLGQGPFMTLYLRLDSDYVCDARYRTMGCGVSIASGSALTELIIGQTISECLSLTPESIADALDGVPPDKAHGPVLAITALRDALARTDRVGSLPLRPTNS